MHRFFGTVQLHLEHKEGCSGRTRNHGYRVGYIRQFHVGEHDSLQIKSPHWGDALSEVVLVDLGKVVVFDPAGDPKRVV